MTDKDTLRREMQQRRMALSASEIRDAGRRVAERFQELEAFRNSGMVGLFMPTAGEIDIEPLFAHCWDLGKTTCIPVYDLKQKVYAFAVVDGATPFRTARYGIREPVEVVEVPVETIQIMAIPGTAFDTKGHRLGRGGGYYDRLMDGFHGVAAGVAFDFQIVDAVPVEPHDRPVDWIISERRVVKV